MSADQLPATTDATGAEPLTPPSGEAAIIPADAGGGAGAGAVALPASETAPSAETTVAAPAAPIALPVGATAGASATPVIRPAGRRLHAGRAGIARVLRFAFVLALFIGGIAFGYQAHLSSQVATGGPIVDPATAGNQASPVVREFIAAVATNDADAIRSAVPTAPYKLFTYEMERWSFQEVTSVEMLATFEDGTRTSTAFVMNGRDAAGNPIAINLIVETEDSNIVSFK